MLRCLREKVAKDNVDYRRRCKPEHVPYNCILLLAIMVFLGVSSKK
jgi:hypothetical protein